MPRRQTPESSLLKACTDLLSAERIWHERRNTGALRDGKRFVRFSKPGTADIMATILIPNTRVHHVLWLELKSATGRQRDKQKDFQLEVEDAKHTYLLIRDVDELRSWLREHGAIGGGR